MAEMVADCPRCGVANMTFDVTKTLWVGRQGDWQNIFEAFSSCRHCKKSTVFVIVLTVYDFNRSPEAGHPEQIKGAVNSFFAVNGFVSSTDTVTMAAPEHTPPDIAVIFEEAAACHSIKCWNATGAMLRLCIDLATKGLLPTADTPGLNSHTRKTLAPRLDWLIVHGHIPTELRELSTCIREDGNDAAHDGTLKKADAEDLIDFTTALFERLFTEPARLNLAKERRDRRRAGDTN